MKKILLLLFSKTLIILLTGCHVTESSQTYYACDGTQTSRNISIEETRDADISAEISNRYSEQGSDAQSIEETPDNSADVSPAPDNQADSNFEIYSILGTAESLSGTRWDNMLAWRENAVSLAEQYRDIVILNKNPNENVVYLTFDDGPDPVNTVSVINTLIEYGVSATFFFTGENMRRHSDVVQMAYDAGFTIGLHSYSHPHFTNLSEDELIRELNTPNDILESITGSRSTIMRPPYGAVGSEEIQIISEQGYIIYLWSLDTLDWAQSDPTEILRNIQEYLRPGDIILLHAFSGQSMSAAILPEIIEFILEMGYDIRALPQ